MAADSWQNINCPCVIKHFKPKGNHPKRWQICQNLFVRETEILKKLGNHDQIPQVLDCFEDPEGFYLVQELVMGNLLSDELPVSGHDGSLWSEVQCIELLRDVLGILEFVHTQGVIHGDLKPNNLMRRTCDHRLVLIDFGAAHPIRPTPAHQSVIPVPRSNIPLTTRPLGYIPAEQLRGQAYPNSDLYALGMIAIQCLTGLNPAQLPAAPDTGEVSWQTDVSVSDSLACLLNHMICSNFQDRYQSASDAQTVLQRLAIAYHPNWRSHLVVDTDAVTRGRGDAQQMNLLPVNPTLSESPELKPDEVSNNVVYVPPSVVQTPIVFTKEELLELRWYAKEFALACWPKLPPLVTGIGAGIATSNVVAISFSLYSLFHGTPANPGVDLLARATRQYQQGHFNQAIALAKSVPLNSSAYVESVTTIQKWRQEWNQAAAQFKAVEVAFHQQHWSDVLEAARQTPNITYWQKKIEPFVKLAQPELETHAKQLLKRAYQRAASQDFTGAIAFLKQIPQETPTGAKIYPQLSEYQKKQQIQAESLLQKAYQRAAAKDFSQALKYLSQIPQDTPIYHKAQLKIVEYSQKQNFQELNQQPATSSADLSQEKHQSNPPAPSSQQSKTVTTKNLNPGSHLQEATP